ncbi:MAG: EAL domain-containing protein [Endozoicomonas sp.]
MGLENRGTIRILVVDSSSEEGEALLNAFRDAGYHTRAHHVTSMVSLEQALSEGKKWDLLLISELPPELKLSSILECIELHGRDIPGVVLSEHLDDYSQSIDLLKKGVRVVIPRDSGELLLLVADREFSDLNTRRQYRRMSVALHESEKQRRNLFDDDTDAIVYVSAGIVRYANPAFYQLLGLTDDVDLVDTPFRELVAGYEQKNVEEFLIHIEDSGQALAAFQCPLMFQNKQAEEVRVMVAPTSYEGHFTLSLLIRTQDEVVKEPAGKSVRKEPASVGPDKVSGLYDKKNWQDQLDVAVQRVVADKDNYAIICLSLDTIKMLQTKGAAQLGKPLLQSVARRLGMSLKDHKGASWGNGIFMVLLQSSDEKIIQDLADQILQDVAGKDVKIGKNNLPVKLSLGAIQLNNSNCDSKTLLVRAREACTQAIRQGGGRLCFYKPRKVSVVSSVEKQLAGMVNQALKKDNMKLQFQPVVSLKGSRYDYYEVLLSLTDARGREHTASSFRSQLDQNSLWGKVDRWQLLHAGKELKSKHQENKNTRIIMHLGGNAIVDKEFLPWMGVALKTAGIPAKSVVVELSEQNIVRYKKEAPAFFNALRQMGCGTGISEFGCSLKPMETIESLKLDFVKVDASFTKDLTNENKGEELKAMIKALSEKGRKVVVPQVTNPSELAPLWHTGVDYIQGDFLQGPSTGMNYDFDGDF